MKALADVVQRARELPKMGSMSKIDADFAIVHQRIITPPPPPPPVPQHLPKPALNLQEDLDDVSGYDDYGSSEEEVMRSNDDKYSDNDNYES